MGFELREFHLLHLNLHAAVGELRLYVRLQLGGLLTAYLALVESLGVVGLGGLQVEAQKGRADVHAVAAMGIDLKNLRADGRHDDFLEGGHDAPRGRDADVDGAAVPRR